MNVLMTLPSLNDPGGVAGYYRAVLPALKANGTSIRLLEIGRTRGYLRFLHPLIDQLALACVLRREPVDIIHVNPSLDWKSFVRDGLFILQALRRKYAVVVFFHGWQTPFEHTIEGSLWAFFRATYGRAHSFVVLSYSFADKLRKWGVVAPLHVTTTAVPDELTSGFSIERKIESIRSESLPPILFMARLEMGKGIFETIEAVKALVERGIDARLDIAGDGSAAGAVRKRIIELGSLSCRIRMLGYLRGEQKIQALISHHVYCFPSHSEGMPVSILEAMAFGMAVVTRAVGGIKDFFKEGEMGYMTEDADPETLANLVQKLLSDRATMAEMARFNNAYIRERCLASRAAENLKEIYREAYALRSTGGCSVNSCG